MDFLSTLIVCLTAFTEWFIILIALPDSQLRGFLPNAPKRYSRAVNQ